MTTLREELQKHKGKVVRIGAKSAFLFIDEVGDDTEQRIDKLDDYLLACAVEQHKDYVRRVNECVKRERKKVEDARQALADGYLTEANGTKKLFTGVTKRNCERVAARTEEEILEAAQKSQQEMKSKARAINSYYSSYVRLLDRPVRKSYPSDPIYDGHAQIIVIEGKEVGKYWLRSEYKEDHKE